VGDYTADRRLYLDKDGNLVEADDPARLTKLVDVGGRLTEAQARGYGLLDDAKAKAAPANKAKAAPDNKAAS
jgi:hypothetical protein